MSRSHLKTLRFVYKLHKGVWLRVVGSHLVNVLEEFPVSGPLFVHHKNVWITTNEGREIRSFHDKYNNLIISVK